MVQSKHLTEESTGPRYLPAIQSLHGVPARPGIQSVQAALPFFDDLPIPQIVQNVAFCSAAYVPTEHFSHIIGGLCLLNVPGIHGKQNRPLEEVCTYPIGHSKQISAAEVSEKKPGRQFSQPPEAFFRPGVQLSQEHELWQSVHLILWSSSSRKRKRLFAVGILFASNDNFV